MDEINEISEVFKAFSDPTRLRLIKMLMDHHGVLCVNALAHRLGVSQSAVSQHLRVLRQMGLVVAERKGSSVHYAISKEKLSQHRSLVKTTLGADFF